MEALYPEGKGKTAPRTNRIPSALPEEYCDCATCNAGDGGSEDEHTAESLVRGIYGRDDAKLEDEGDTYER